MSGEGILLNGKYELIATTIDHEEIGSYIGYGIRYGEHTVTDISLDRAKIENLIEGKKFSSDSDTEGYDAVIKYNGNEYYYISKTKMLITSGKGAKLDIIEDFLAEDSNFFSCN